MMVCIDGKIIIERAWDLTSVQHNSDVHMEKLHIRFITQINGLHSRVYFTECFMGTTSLDNL